MHSLDGDTQEDLQPLLYSKITSLDLTMRPDVLQVGESYSLILKGVAPSGAFIEKGYKFTVNKRPEFGKMHFSLCKYYYIWVAKL